MKIDARVRKVVVFGGLALTLVAVYAVDETPQQRVDTARHQGAAAAEDKRSTPRPAATPAPTLALDLSRLKRGGNAPQAVDAFGAKDWNPPPRKLTPKEAAAQRAVAEPPPPPPQAPPLPFTYVGMLGSEDETIVFLAQQDTNHAVKKGDVINGTYRVDELEPGRVVLTYLPLEQRQTLTAKVE